MDSEAAAADTESIPVPGWKVGGSRRMLRNSLQIGTKGRGSIEWSAS
jgi:hypothetical protein